MRKYIALWAGIFAVCTLGGIIIAALVIAGRAIIDDPTLWWIPILIFGASMLATAAVALDYLSDLPSDPTE